MSETIKKETKPLNIYQRMSLVTDEIGDVAKNLKVLSYKAVSEVDVLNAVKPIEKKHGIYSYQESRTIIKDDVLVVASKDNLRVRVATVYRFVNIDNGN